MSDLCETVSAVLGLYAEGELHDPLPVELVREHLLGCTDCRETLEVYDDLTRTLLSGGFSGGGPLGVDGGPLGVDAWTDIERQRRVEGVLRRLNWQASTPSLAVTGEAAGNGSRVPEAAVRSSDALERFALLERSGSPRLHLTVDDLVDDSHASTSRRKSGPLGASGPWRFALAAAALLGIVSVWIAAALRAMQSAHKLPVASRCRSACCPLCVGSVSGLFRQPAEDTDEDVLSASQVRRSIDLSPRTLANSPEWVPRPHAVLGYVPRT